MPDIFISYAHEDLERVRPIVKELEKRGWRVFWDKKIPAGQQWHLYIAKALTASHCVIVVWSQHSILSDSVIEEAQIAKTKGLLVPLRLDPVELPLGFGLIQAPDLSEWKNNTHDSEFLQLMDAVASKIPFSPQPVIAQPPILKSLEVVSAQGTTITPQKSTVLKPKPQLKKVEKITLPSKKEIGQTVKALLSKKQIQLAAVAFAVFILLLFVNMASMNSKQEKASANQSLTELPPRVEAVKPKPQADDSLLRRAKEARVMEKEAAATREENARLKARLREDSLRQAGEAKLKADALQKALKLKAVQDATARREAALSKSTAPKIGQEYDGGIFFYVDAVGRRGLVATKADLPGNYSWEAAKNACQNLDENGYSDWYLPGRDELNKLYQAKSAVGGFASSVYWSSTEDGAGYAWGQSFDDGNMGYNGNEGSEWRVRPVRAFTY